MRVNGKSSAAFIFFFSYRLSVVMNHHLLKNFLCKIAVQCVRKNNENNKTLCAVFLHHFPENFKRVCSKITLKCKKYRTRA